MGCVMIFFLGGGFVFFLGGASMEGRMSFDFFFLWGVCGDWRMAWGYLFSTHP